MQLSSKQKERYWSRVDKNTSTECWHWTGTKDNRNYGVFYVNPKIVKAHRLALILDGTDVPSSKCVMHKCDNPQCVNPNHLSVGTLADNNQDKQNKMRHVYGEGNHTCKLSEQDVKNIRNTPRERGYLVKLSEKYNVSKPTIEAIVYNKSWKHLL